MSPLVRLLLLLCAGVAILKGVDRYRRAHQFENAPGHLSAVRLVNDAIKAEELDLSGKRYVALYHSASWCPPCQAFSPHLAEFYHASDKRDYELVMINHDRSAADMAQYMRQHRMEFPAIAQAEAGVWGKAPSGGGIPNLVVIDMQTREVIAESYQGSSYQGPEVPLQALREKIRTAH